MRLELAQALAAATLEPGSLQAVPFDYRLLAVARGLGIPPWVLEGFRADEPPVEWIVRVLEFTRMEQGVRVTRR